MITTITLTQSGLEAEYSRVKERLRQTGQVDLLPELHFAQVWQIIRKLKAEGVSVKPSGFNRSLPDGKQEFLFAKNTKGSVTLFATNNKPAAPPQPMVKRLPEPIRLVRPQVQSPVTGRPEPSNLLELKEKDVGLDWRPPRTRSSRVTTTKAGEEGNIFRLLHQVSKDLRSRGVYYEKLDWSLEPKQRSHIGPRFLKKRRTSGADDRRKEGGY